MVSGENKIVSDVERKGLIFQEFNPTTSTTSGETDDLKSSNDPVFWKINVPTRHYFAKNRFNQHKDLRW